VRRVPGVPGFAGTWRPRGVAATCRSGRAGCGAARERDATKFGIWRTAFGARHRRPTVMLLATILQIDNNDCRVSADVRRLLLFVCDRLPPRCALDCLRSVVSGGCWVRSRVAPGCTLRCSRLAAGCPLGTGSVRWEGRERMGARQDELEDLRPLCSGNTKQKQRVSTGAVYGSAGGEELLQLRWRPPLMPVRLSLHGAFPCAQALCLTLTPIGQPCHAQRH
jgi:hypothetical protein